MKRRQALEWMLKDAAVGVAVAIAPGLVFGSQNEISDITTVVDDSNFAEEVSGYKGKAIVLFYSMWEDVSCRMFPIIRELVRDYGNQVKFCSYELDESYQNWDTDPKAMGKWKELLSKYNVRGIPCTNMYLNGVLDNRIRGPPSKEVPEKVMLDYVIKWIKEH